MTLLQTFVLILMIALLLYSDHRRAWMQGLARVAGVIALLWVIFGQPRGILGAPPSDPWPTVVAGAALLAWGSVLRWIGLGRFKE